MKKNGQYVGVDEKYIPEEEKYVDEAMSDASDEIKDSINTGVKQFKNYVTDKDNQEKMKNAGKKGLKILKGVGIGYIVFFGVFFLITISIIVFVFFNMFSMSKRVDDVMGTANGMISDINDSLNDTSNNNSDVKIDFESKMFNNSFELYSGTISYFRVEKLLDSVVTSNKKEEEHIITVVYGDNVTTDSDEIVNIKHNLDDTKEYEVSFDYDDNDFINKVTLVEID